MNKYTNKQTKKLIKLTDNYKQEKQTSTSKLSNK